MSDEQPSRPRRAMLPEEFSSTEALGDAADDTPTSQPSAARRGMVIDEDHQEETDPSGTDRADDASPDGSSAEAAPGTNVDEPSVMLPVVAVPPPAGRGSEHDAFRPPTESGHRFASAALPEEAPAAPRRSATSAHSPSEWTSTPPAKPQHSADRTPATPTSPDSSPASSAGTPQPGDDAHAASDAVRPDDAEDQQQRKFRPGIVWAVGTLVVALIVMGSVYLASRNPSADPSGSVSPTNTASTSQSEPGQQLSEANLLTPAQADTVVSGGAWTTAKTLTTFSGEGTACMPVVLGSTTPTEAMLRTLDSTTATQTAALHLLEQFNNAEDAKAQFKQRQAKLASCDLVPAFIVDSGTVAGLGDEAVQVTVALQEATTQYHTVFLVRTGSAVNVFGFANNDGPIPADKVLAAAAAVIGGQCSIVGGACPSNPTITPGPPPPTGVPGWLAQSDLPRITPGAGRWTPTDPRAIDFPGTGCENLAIGSVSGPTERAQVTYVLSQDPAAPQGFGVDEFLFTFPSPADAAAFAVRLKENIAGCTARAETATISDAATAALPVPDGKSSGSGWTITLATGATPVQFQVGVGFADGSPHVSYLVANSTATFKFTPDQVATLTARAGQRSTQK